MEANLFVLVADVTALSVAQVPEHLGEDGFEFIDGGDVLAEGFVAGVSDVKCGGEEMGRSFAGVAVALSQALGVGSGA